MRYRAILLSLCGALALAASDARAQSIPLGGFDLSGWYDMATAAGRNKTDDVRAMLIAGKNPDIADTDGQTPLGYAASFGNFEMAKVLLHYNAPVDRRDSLGNTPLHWAAQRGSVDVMQLLINAKAPIDAQNRQGITPLMLAASRGQVGAVRVLIKNGADPRKQDYTGRDATGWAEGKAQVLQALRAGKAG